MVYEILLALFGVIGLGACIRFVWGLMVYPVHGALILLPGRGDGRELEHQLKGLKALGDEGKLAGETILLADCGLDEEGLELAAKLTQRYPNVGFCTLEQISNDG